MEIPKGFKNFLLELLPDYEDGGSSYVSNKINKKYSYLDKEERKYLFYASLKQLDKWVKEGMWLDPAEGIYNKEPEKIYEIKKIKTILSFLEEKVNEGFRFKKKFNILPGVNINLSKSGISTSIGRRGADVNIGPNGETVNVGLPGSGLSYRKKLSTNSNTSIQKKSVELLKNLNFEFEKVNSDSEVEMVKVIPNDVLIAIVSPDGNVNGKTLNDYLKSINE